MLSFNPGKLFFVLLLYKNNSWFENKFSKRGGCPSVYLVEENNASAVSGFSTFEIQRKNN